MAGEIQLNGTTALTESAGEVTLNNVDSATNRTNLGLGTAATSASTDFASSSRTITAGTGLSGGGDLSTNRTINVSFSANESNVKTALNATGSAPIYACRAWINFDGTSGSIGTGRANGNVSGVTDNGGSGNYTVNFANNMPDANYVVVAGGLRSSPYSSANLIQTISRSSSAVNIKTPDSGSSFDDFLFVDVAIFR